MLDTTLLATDLQRSILQTLKANQPRHAIAYSPYGHRHPENGLLSLLGFNGERPDPVTGHYLLGNGYRAFNSRLMRFNSPDSMSPFEKGGINSYAYCSGDPINRYDPTGRKGELVAAKLVGWSRRAQVNVVKRSGVIQIGSGKYKLPVGISPEEAVSDRAKLYKLKQMTADESSRLVSRQYEFDLSNARRDGRVMETMTGKPASENTYLQMLEFIGEDKNGVVRLSWQKLDKRRFRPFDPPIRIRGRLQSSDRDELMIETFDAYKQKLEKINNPFVGEIYKESSRLWSLYVNKVNEVRSFP